MATRFARARRRKKTPKPLSRTSSDLGPSSWGHGLGREHCYRAREVVQVCGKCVFWVYGHITTSISLATRDGCEKESVRGVAYTIWVDSLAEEFLCNCYFLRGGVLPWGVAL